MKTIKTIIQTEFKIVSILCIVSSFSIFLLLFRMKLTHTNYYLFLVWNLFLAGVPYAISTYLNTIKKPNIIYLLSICFFWLLFIPNAPYIITDLFHLKYSSQQLIWLDTLVIVAFAITGMLLFLKSVYTMETIFKTYVKKPIVTFSLPFLFIIIGFGVYLGRFLRFNSWEIINKPMSIIKPILDIITQPNLHQKAWQFTFIFGLFLWIGYEVFKRFIKLES
ncbi:DUF1361 domain-containing protein [Olleya sp. R77988]|uniref:DUF1361 domain-containing protein n=1 Tax=Olleya sp. R77988 TaxID=3093875 RepID=UPI0037C630D6